MLERATAYVEPGVNLFLRRVEKPAYTKRALHPSFWQYGTKNKLTAAWWPGYLQDIRNNQFGQSQARSRPPNALKLVNDDNASLCEKVLSTNQRQRGGFNSNRTFSISHNGRGNSTTESRMIDEAEDEYPQHGALDEPESPGAGKYQAHESSGRLEYFSGGPITLPLLDQQLPPSEVLRTLLNSDDKEAYGKVWQLFIQVGGHARFAADVLQYLSTSQHGIHLDHAIRAYRLIPIVDRGLADYQAAIKAGCGRKQQRLAVEIHEEALENGFHAATTNTLLAFLVRNGSWKTAARTWMGLPPSQKNAADPRNHHIWLETDQCTTLPVKLLQLMKRLEQNAAIFASERDQVLGLCMQLLYRVMGSSDIMARITGSGTLALLDRFDNLGLLKPHHYFSGIQTLNKMVGSRNRHQLASLLYRNLNLRFPKVRLPRSVLGSLIAILCESDGGHVGSRVILHRFATDWGKPDRQAYQKVLTACAQYGDSVNVHEVFTELCSDYGKPSKIEYITPLLYVHARIGNVPETKKQFDRLHSDFAIKPNTYCWNILITAYARARDGDGAFQVFRNMKPAGVVPDQRTYGILMSICARSGDIQAVLELVEAARQQSITGTTAMIDSLVHSYCRNDHVEDAEDLVEAATEMRLKGSRTRMWNTLLRYHAFRADTDAVLQTQERMRELSVPADDMTYAALMQALVNIGRTKDAASILRSLHFSNTVTATVFHYSLVLYGYAMENNIDMVAVIYNEMVERFPRIGLSPRLSRLHSYFHRDTLLSQTRLNQALRGKPMSRGLRLSKTLDFLAQILLEIKESDLAVDDPQPGLGRRSPAEAFPSVYIEFLIGAFARNGALQKAENLLSRYQALVETTRSNYASKAPSFQLLTAVMTILVQQQRFAMVALYWNKALTMAIDQGRRRTLDLSDPPAEAGIPRAATVPPIPSVISLNMSAEGPGKTMAKPFLDRGDTRILAAHQENLAGPLAQYMHSLSAQNLTADLPPLVRRLEEMGFSLSSKNWNHYVQILSYSNNADMHLLAFRTFEEKLLPNMPPWNLMKRGKWSKRKIVDLSGDAVTEEPLRRKLVERFRPGTLVPTYWTMVYLGLALMKAQQRSLRGEKSGVSALRAQAPGTVSAVSRMPYLREKAQGLLLRGSALQGDLQKRPRRPRKADRAGLRGSRSPLDHIPLDFPHHELESLLRQDPISFSQSPEEEPRAPIHYAEQTSGEIQRSPLVLEAAGRYEREQEYLRRLQAEERDKRRLLKQMREDAAQPQLMADDKRGEPFFEANLQGQEPKLAAANTNTPSVKEGQELLNTALSHFIDKKQRIPRLRDSKDASDIRPAALLSAARRPKAAERLHLLRRRRRRGPATLRSMTDFKSDIRRKISLALTTYQPRLRVPNRLRRAFTRNRLARRIRKQSESTQQNLRSWQPVSKTKKSSDQNAAHSDVGASE